ncbi:MAG TPA: hypothetical protein VI454_07210, partial [Verrucomicrobiae bacterium]
MSQQFAVAAHWAGEFDERALRAWASKLRHQLGEPVSLGLLFMTPRFFPHAETILEIFRVHAQIPVLAGCSSTSLICNAHEIEVGGIVLALYHLPGAELRAVRFKQEQVEEASGAYRHVETGVQPDDV